eukprot:gene36727-biopygen22585
MTLSLTFVLGELHTRLPLDICREIRQTLWEPLTDDTIHEAVRLWRKKATQSAALNRFGYIELWDVRQVTNMDRLFQSKKSFNEDLSRWDVSHVRSMKNMFAGATSFDQPLEHWDVSQVIKMLGMFHGASSYNQLLDGWDVSQ